MVDIEQTITTVEDLRRFLIPVSVVMSSEEGILCKQELRCREKLFLVWSGQCLPLAYACRPSPTSNDRLRSFKNHRILRWGGRTELSHISSFKPVPMAWLCLWLFNTRFWPSGNTLCMFISITLVTILDFNLFCSNRDFELAPWAGPWWSARSRWLNGGWNYILEMCYRADFPNAVGFISLFCDFVCSGKPSTYRIAIYRTHCNLHLLPRFCLSRRFTAGCRFCFCFLYWRLSVSLLVWRGRS